jgi:hypothetical protein
MLNSTKEKENMESPATLETITPKRRGRPPKKVFHLDYLNN